MPFIVKPSNYLLDSQREFYDIHVDMSKRIHHCIFNADWTELSNVVRGLSDQDAEMVHYAFYDLYGYDYELKIRSVLGSYSAMRSHGLV